MNSMIGSCFDAANGITLHSACVREFGHRLKAGRHRRMGEALGQWSPLWSQNVPAMRAICVDAGVFAPKWISAT
jgi:hypothetical protein